MFRLEPESAHALALAALSLLPAPRGSADPPELAQSVWGLELRNPIGLAAGMDKDARAVSGWEWLGFGFVELGTVTPRPQAGNARPRLWRLVEEQALINRLGFPSAGMEVVARRVARIRARGARIRLGISLGPNKTTSKEDVPRDFQTLIARMAALADFIVVNVSSPNTPGLREFQAAQEMRSLLATILAARSAALSGGSTPTIPVSGPPASSVQPTASASSAVSDATRLEAPAASTQHLPDRPICPLLVKLAPNLEQGALEQTCDVLLELGVDGVVACNTTTARDALRRGDVPEGGLSGQPLKLRAREMIRAIYRHSQGRLPIVGVGGIGSVADAYAHIAAGASLVELYTALVFEGPALVARIKGELCALLRRDGFKSIAEVVGSQA
jgi:dihydroorotate dehydrogenase